MQLKAKIQEFIDSEPDRVEALNTVRRWLHELSPAFSAPVDFVQLVPIEKVEPNDYNPNSVARVEMGLLIKSIEHDGYTQPIVTIYDHEQDRYVIVDGFHRYFVMKSNTRIRENMQGLLPITVIAKTINDRMASTIRHNRARGKHSVDGMANMVFRMLDGGLADADICNELGMEPEELLRLKHITGFSKLFANAQYRKAWINRSQIEVKERYLRESTKPS